MSRHLPSSQKYSIASRFGGLCTRGPSWEGRERVGVWRNGTCRLFVRFKMLVLLLEGIETSHHPCHHQARSLLNWVKSESVSYSIISDSVIPWIIAHQAPLSMELFRQEYWSGFPLPSPGDLPDPGIQLRSLALQADPLPSKAPGKPVVGFQGTVV